jgi:hypothetical protein
LIFAASDVGYILVKEAVENFAEYWYCTQKGSQNNSFSGECQMYDLPQYTHSFLFYCVSMIEYYSILYTTK